MTAIRTASYGSWKSPITSTLIVTDAINIEWPAQVALDGKDVYWVETRPTENGRTVIVRWSPDGTVADVTPPTFNARTTVHEYGGGAFTVEDGTVYFSNFVDQRLYRQDPGGMPQPITREADLRYADGIIDRRRRRIICVCEDQTKEGREATNSLVGIRLDGVGSGQTLVSGNDFYASPRISPDGARLAWLTWNHPDMPWDSSELWVGDIMGAGAIGHEQRVAGGANESVCEPKWAPDGTLYFISDRTGWWNLYRWKAGRVDALCKMEAEFGVPHWSFGISTYGFTSAGRIICTYTRDGSSYLASLDTSTRQIKTIDIPYTSIVFLQATPYGAVLIAGSPREAMALARLSQETGKTEVLRRSTEVAIDPGCLSTPRAIEFPTENGLTAHAFFYAPMNRDFVAAQGERPPLLVISHGGPTGAHSSEFNLMIQYWTSRGFAVADVNYGGSSGYGRTYRQRLDGQWGIVDVDDCVNCARYLAKNGEVDADRLAIRGGSAGGYTTLAALTFRRFFKAGASYFGVSDLEALAGDTTHKFESRYLDRLIGPYPARRDLYRERSPINFVERFSCPVIFFQGDEDKVVPPNQAEKMVDALRQKKMPVAYLLFEGEQHGFRRAENIKRALDAELYFYSKIFRFPLPEPIEPVPIENLK
jgi:dipeptidyl aminopeptidase/acylaminoacyl peptidase